MTRRTVFLAICLGVGVLRGGAQQETLTPLEVGGLAPQTFESLWAGYDPRAACEIQYTLA